MTLGILLKLIRGTADDRLIAKEYVLKDPELLLRVAGMTAILGASRSDLDSKKVKEEFGDSLTMWEKCRHFLEDSSTNNELLNSLVKKILKETI